MTTINLRDYYPSAYTNDCFTEVSDEVAGALAEDKRDEHAYYERRRWHRAFYSLNAGDGIENNAIYHAPSSEDVFMDNMTRNQLDAALAALPDKQRRRIEAYAVYGMSYQAVAETEGVDESSVRESIGRGLRRMKNNLKKVL